MPARPQSSPLVLAVLGAWALAGCGGDSSGPPAVPPSEDAAADGAQGPAPDVPVVLASGQKKPWSLALDRGHVYWVNADTMGGVYRVPKDGGAVAPLLDQPMGRVESFGLDESSVYVPARGVITAVPVGGGPARRIADAPSVTSLAVGAGRVFWVEVAPPGEKPTAKSVPVSGGVATEHALPLEAARLPAYFAVADADAVYVSFVTGGIARVPTDGGAVTFLDAPGARGLATDPTAVVYGHREHVGAVPKSGGPPVEVVKAQSALGVATDGRKIYFVEDEPRGRVLSVPRSGGPVRVLAEDQANPHGIAVDETRVYWTCIDEGTIKAVAKEP